MAAPPRSSIFPWTGLQRNLAVAPDQMNQFTWTGSMQMTGASGAGVAVFNVYDFGAVGNGTTDDTQAFADAAAGLFANGGVLLIPPGNFLLSASTMIPSYSLVQGMGPASRLIVAAGFVNPGGAGYSLFYNENHDAVSITDEDITVDNLFFDDQLNPLHGAFHHLKFRMAQRIVIQNCLFFYGGDATAIRGCNVVSTLNCRAYSFNNCAYDHWEGCNDVLVEACFAASATAVQIINFNPETEPPYATGTVGRRFRMLGNALNGVGSAGAIPCQIEPLTGNNTKIEDVVISGNQFNNVYLVARGQVKNIVISDNTFTGYPASGSNIIRLHPLFGYTPDTVVISGNTIKDPGTAAGQFGVIRCEADLAVVTGNIITGTSYTGEPFYGGSNNPSQYGNFFEKPGVTGRMHQGFLLDNPNDPAQDARSAFGFVDLSGNAIRKYMSGNLLQEWITDESGNPRQLSSVEADSDNSDFAYLIGASFNSHIRVSPNAGLTATGTTYAGALQLTKGFNTVTTVPAASGARLPYVGPFISITGWQVAAWNGGTETLAVYPATNAYIGDAAVGVHDRVLPGWVKVWYATDATHWIVMAEFEFTPSLAGDTVSALENSLADVDLTTAPETQPPTYNYNHVLLYGQSLALGAEGTPGLSTTAKYGSVFLGTTLGAQNNTTPTSVWLINGSGFNPLQINNTQAEAPIYEGLATYRALTYRSQDITTNTDNLMLASACAIGGQAIAALQQGAAPDIFNRLVSCMSQAHTTATGLGKTYGVSAMVWLQGESNSGTAQATYAAALRDIYADFCTAALAETGQTANPALFMYQTTARDTNYNTTNLGVQMAQLDIGLNDAGCFMVGPVYPYNSSDNLHLPANSYRWWGAQLGKVMHRVLTLGQNWQPLHITAATMRGQRVLLEYHVPVGPLVFQDSWLEPGWTPGGGTVGAANAPYDATDKGFTVINNAGTVQPIASVVLAAANQVLITLASAPSGAPYFVRYADGSAGHYGHGSVRDSDPALADDIYLDLQAGQAACERQWDASAKKYPLYNWAVSQYVAITVV